MVTKETLTVGILPQFPNTIFLEHDKNNYFIVNVTDASNFTQQEEIEWKQKNPNYSTTDPQDGYYLLTIEEIQLEEQFYNDDLILIQVCTHVLVTAGDFWHDHITSKLN